MTLFSLDMESLQGAVGKRIVAATEPERNGLWPTIELDDGSEIVATSREEVWLERRPPRPKGKG